MPFQAWRSSLPNFRLVVAGCCGAAAVLAVGVTGMDLRRRRLDSVKGPRETDLVSSVEVARYPCEVLKGYDVVVSDYYYRNAVTGDRAIATPTAESVTHSWSTIRRWGLSARQKLLPLWFQSPEVIESIETSARFRTPVGLDEQDHINRLSRVRYTEGSSEENGPKVETPMSANWPAGTSRYSGMTLVRNQNEKSAGAAGDESRGLLRFLVDRATQQTLVKCLQHHMSSGLCLSDPTVLAAPYQRTMISGFALLPQPLPPLRVCCLGVGGGALPMFLQQYFAPRLQQLHLVDVEPKVLKAAVQHMGLRQLAQACDLQICAEDAAAFLRGSVAATSLSLVDTSNHRMYDVIFADIFVGSAVPEHIQSEEFLRSVRSRLSAMGVAVFNLPSHLDHYATFIDRCTNVFGVEEVFVANGCGGGGTANCVVFAMRKNAHEGLSKRQFLRRCDLLQRASPLPFRLQDQLPWSWHAAL